MVCAWENQSRALTDRDKDLSTSHLWLLYWSSYQQTAPGWSTHEGHRCWFQQCPYKFFHSPVKENKDTGYIKQQLVNKWAGAWWNNYVQCIIQTPGGTLPFSFGPQWWRRTQRATWEAAEPFWMFSLLWTPTPTLSPEGSSRNIQPCIKTQNLCYHLLEALAAVQNIQVYHLHIFS